MPPPFLAPPGFRWPARGVALLLCTLGLLTAAAVLFCFNPNYHGFYPVCLFYRTTGLLCPGCGSLRALHQLLHGHLAAAFHCNALLVLALPLLAWRMGRFCVRKHQQLPATFTVRPLWLWGALGLMVLFSILRNLPGPQFAWLAP
ncbi:MAG TPA: DUF2752 domain-containing protein [Bacillota bacterium]|nr:DUF2752 domain-containing protein [Bacillota bacterium]